MPKDTLDNIILRLQNTKEKIYKNNYRKKLKYINQYQKRTLIKLYVFGNLTPI